jgi:hypothetical protein
MNPYSGLVDMFEAKGLLSKEGNSLKYTLADGTIIKQFRKAWERNEDQSLDKVMEDFIAHPHKHEAVAVQLDQEESEE